MKVRVLAVVASAALGVAGLANAAPANAAPATYNVRDYGARGDGSTLDDDAIDRAITAANAAGGGIVAQPLPQLADVGRWHQQLRDHRRRHD